MYLRYTSALFAIVCTLAFASTTWAADPSICDPEEDQCECPNDGTYDVCYEVPVSKLMSPDDPATLRQAANIQSEWDSKSEAYLVTVDATGLTAAGVMTVNSNRGHWDSVEELHNYIGALIGQDFSDYCHMGGFPPLRIRQVGATTRYDQFDEKWAPVNTGSLIYDAITDENGMFFLGQTEFDPFAAANACAGTDPKSFASDSNGSLVGDQCSVGVSGSREVCGRDWGSSPCFPECRMYDYKMASTLLETSVTMSIGDTLTCTGERINGNLRCTKDRGVIVHGRNVVDEMKLENDFFDNQAGPFAGTPRVENDVVEVFEKSTGDNGVCGKGRAIDGTNYQIDLQTKDGAYDPNATMCDF